MIEKIKEVIWRDSNRYLDQIEKDYSFKYCTIKTVGYLISEDREQLVLSQDLINDDCRGTIVIPKENIISIKCLK